MKRYISGLLSLLFLVAGVLSVNAQEKHPVITPDNALQVTEQAIFGHGSNDVVSWSPDGQTLAVGGSVGIWLYDAQDFMAAPWLLRGHTRNVTAVVYHPTEPVLASAGRDKTVRLWDTQSGENYQTFQVQQDRGDSIPTALTFSPDGRLLVASIEVDLFGSTSQIWDVTTGEIWPWPGSSTLGSVMGMVFSPDGQFLASKDSSRGLIRLWDVQTGEQVRLLEGHDRETIELAFSPDGRFLASGGNEDSILIHDVASGNIVTEFKGKNWVADLAFGSDGQVLYILDYNGNVWLYDIAAGRYQDLLSNDLHFGENSFAFSPDGSRLAVTGATLRIWNMTTADHPVVADIADATSQVSHYAFNSEGTRLVVGGYDVRLWDVAAQQQLGVWELGESSYSNRVAFSRDGKQFATDTDGYRQGSYGTVSVWDVATNELLATLGAPAAPLILIGYYDTWLITGSRREVTLWETTTFTPQNMLKGITDGILSPDGRYLAGRSWNNTIQVWDMATSTITAEFDFEGEWDNLIYSPDGAQFATIGCAGDYGYGFCDRLKISILDAMTGDLLSDISLEAVEGSALAYNPDGSLLAVGYEDGTIQLRDARSGALLASLTGNTSTVTYLAFTPDGTFLASSGDDGVVRLWGVP